MKIKTIYGQPVLDITISDTDKSSPNYGKEYGLNRDRNPDRDWGELRTTCMSYAKEEELTPALKQLLLEDLAYTYGRNTKMFAKKLKEFNFI